MVTWSLNRSLQVALLAILVFGLHCNMTKGELYRSVTSRNARALHEYKNGLNVLKSLFMSNSIFPGLVFCNSLLYPSFT